MLMLADSVGSPVSSRPATLPGTQDRSSAAGSAAWKR